LGSPSSFNQLVQQLAQLTADSTKYSEGLPFQVSFHWAADQVEALHTGLMQQRDISDFITRFEFDYKSCIVSLKMGESRGHSFLAGIINMMVMQRLTIFTMTAAKDATIAVFPLFSGEIHKKNKIWYQPDSAFGFFEHDGVKPGMVSEVS